MNNIVPGMGQCTVCGDRIYEGLLMCGKHWRELPDALRQDVLLSLRRFRNGDIELTDLRTAQRSATEFFRP